MKKTINSVSVLVIGCRTAPNKQRLQLAEPDQQQPSTTATLEDYRKHQLLHTTQH